MLLLGKPVVEALKAEQTRRIAASSIKPRLAIIQAGNDAASASYIKMKVRYAQSIGAVAEHHVSSGGLDELQKLIDTFNEDPSYHGIIVQLPLPDRSITDQVVGTIAPQKDVDGLSPGSGFKSATAMAVIKLLEFYSVPFLKETVTLVGDGRLVGAPLAEILRSRSIDVTVCDINTTPADLLTATRSARVIVSATGVPGIIKPSMVIDGTTIIDVGTAEDEGAIVGDVDPALLENESLSITPAKGGVGPITVSILFEQLLEAAGL